MMAQRMERDATAAAAAAAAAAKNFDLTEIKWAMTFLFDFCFCFIYFKHITEERKIYVMRLRIHDQRPLCPVLMSSIIFFWLHYVHILFKPLD